MLFYREKATGTSGLDIATQTSGHKHLGSKGYGEGLHAHVRCSAINSGNL